MKKVIALLSKDIPTTDAVINSYASQAEKDLYIEHVQPASSLIAKKQMEILSLKESISLRTDANAGLRKMTYDEVKSTLSKIITLKSEISALENSFEYITDAYADLFEADVDVENKITQAE